VAEDTPKQTRQARWEERINYACQVLGRRGYKHELFALLRHRYGISTRTCERILARARVVMAQRAGKDRAEHKVDALSFYESVVRDPGATTGERLHAQSRIDRLLGLEAPQRLAHGGDPKAPPARVRVTETIVRDRRDLRELNLVERATRLGALEKLTAWIEEAERRVGGNGQPAETNLAD
jgi:hypothetical protein